MEPHQYTKRILLVITGLSPQVVTEETYDVGKYFEQRKSKTNKAWLNKLGKKASEPYLIHSFGRRPHTRFGLNIDAESIHFVSRNNELR